MPNVKNSMPSQGGFYLDYLESLSSITKVHRDIATSFDSINTLYSESSVMEDIILNNYLYLYSAAKQIRPESIKSNFVTESFLSQNFLDSEFSVDKKLNIDIQNGDLTLPIMSTLDLEIISVIVESDSNGSVGDSNNDNENGDIKAITTPTATSVFIYDKVVNSLSMSDLYLSITLKLKELTSANGVYIQLFSDISSSYATIDLIEGSQDGLDWYPIASSFKITELSNINKSDYYIRFQSRPTRFIRIKFSQKENSPISTGFGTRYRYMIGIRNITVKQTIYETAGEYISVPFSSKKALSYINLETEDTGGISYLVSANNGSVWQPIVPNTKLYLYSKTLGLRDGIDIDSIRLKINMDKNFISIDKKTVQEYLSINNSESYFLQNVPVDIKTEFGQHISFGDIQPYTIQLSDISKIPVGILEDESSIDHTAILYYVPFTTSIDLQEKLVLKLNGAKVKNDTSIYSFDSHPDPNHSILVIKNQNLTATSGSLSLTYKKLDMGPLNSQETVLPFTPFYESGDLFLIQEIDSNLNKRTLRNFEYSIVGKTLKINDSSFNSLATYSISYCPAIDISSLANKTTNNKIILQGIRNIPNAKIKFSYSVMSETSASDLQYFTPISNQYILELR